MKVMFYVNDEAVPSEYVFYYHYDNNTGWNCSYWATVLGDWQRNTTVVLKTTLSIYSEIYDGQSYYQPGNYTHQLEVTIP